MFKHFKTPIRLQVNPIECGAVSLGIILDYYGYPNSQSELNEVVGVSRNGSDASSLIKGAQHFGLAAAGRRAMAAEVKKSAKPSIAFFDSCHFVVIERYLLGKYFINDPAKGQYYLSDREFHHRFSGIEISIKGHHQRKKSVRTDFGIGYTVMGFSASILLTALLTSIASGISLKEGLAPAFSMVVNLGLIVLLGGLLWSGCSLFISRLVFNERAFQNQFLEKLAHTSPAFFETRPFPRYAAILAEVSIKSIPEINNFQRVIIGAVIGVHLAQALVFVPFLWILIILSLIIWLLILLFPIMPRSLNQSEHLAELLKKFPEMDSMGQGMGLIKKQLAADHEALRKSYLAGKQSRLRFRAVFIATLLALGFECSIGSSYLQSGSLSHAGLLGSLSFLLTLAVLLSRLGQKAAIGEQDRLALMSELEDQSQKKLKEFHAPEAGSVLAIREGSFAYPGTLKPVLSELNITLHEKGLYAMVGGPISGKSTLLRLMGQKLSLGKGAIYWALENQETIPFALIDDDADLFSGSLLENVRVFAQQYSEHAVTEALEQANIQELFYNRPMGLLSQIDQGGTNLSGGQKKRLLLARALLHRPSLLLLDNFFDSLDEECCKIILANLKKSKITTVFTTFRKVELELSDQVIFIEQGLVAINPHDYWSLHHSAYRSLIIDDERGRNLI